MEGASMKFITTGERVTPQNAYDHHPMVFIVCEDFTAEWTNAMVGRDGVKSWTTTESYAAGTLIRGESWRPEGIISCFRADADGYPIEGAKEMFLGWEYLAHCELCTQDQADA